MKKRKKKPSAVKDDVWMVAKEDEVEGDVAVLVEGAVEDAVVVVDAVEVEDAVEIVDLAMLESLVEVQKRKGGVKSRTKKWIKFRCRR